MKENLIKLCGKLYEETGTTSDIFGELLIDLQNNNFNSHEIKNILKIGKRAYGVMCKYVAQNLKGKVSNMEELKIYIENNYDINLEDDIILDIAKFLI